MTAAIRPIFLVIKSEEIIGYDPLRQKDQTYQKNLSNLTEFRTWCKGGSRNSRVVLIAHQKANHYKSLLETSKEKIPRTWQVFDTSCLDALALPDLIKRYNINNENEAQALHQVFSTLTKGLDTAKIYECLFKPNPEERILEMTRTHKIIPKPIPKPPEPQPQQPQPQRILECYYHLETIPVLDQNFVERIINLTAFIPSRYGEDAFFSRPVNPESAVYKDYKSKPKLKSVLAQFCAWVEAEEEPASHVLLMCHHSGDSLEDILKKESKRVKVPLPQHWFFSNFYEILKKRYPEEPEVSFEVNRLANRFNIQQHSHVQIVAGLAHAVAGQNLGQAILAKAPLVEVIPAKLPLEIFDEESNIFYLKDQDKSAPATEIVEDMLEN